MHPRNPYRNPPDFSSLASAHPSLKPHLIHDLTSGRTTISFKDEGAQRSVLFLAAGKGEIDRALDLYQSRRLTEAIMRRDFGVVLSIPEGRLCPPVPNRMNYVLWIQDVVYAHRELLAGNPSGRQKKIRGLDIGTGSTAIYPLLACKLNPNWEMVGTELDDFSYETALKNVEFNNLQPSIQILKAFNDRPILFPLEEQTFEFCMCNPPFYASKEEIERSAQGKELPPNAVCTGADIEMIYPHGGEEAFVGRMLEESEQFGVRCKWYTSMLGKMSSVKTIVEMLKERSIMNYAITEFVQGQTRRWAVGWSYSDERLPDTTARIVNINPNHPLYVLMPPRTTLVHAFQLHGPSLDVGEVVKVVNGVLDALAGMSVSVSLVRASSVLPGPLTPTIVVGAGEVNDPTLSDPYDGALSAATTVSTCTTSPNATAPLPSAAAAVWVVEAMENSWSRSARRKNKCRGESQKDDTTQVMASTSEVRPMRSMKMSRLQQDQQRGQEEWRKQAGAEVVMKPALMCSILVRAVETRGSGSNPAGGGLGRTASAGSHAHDVAGGDGDGDGAISTARAGRTLELELQWIYGSDRGLFESFAGHIGRKVGAVLKSGVEGLKAL